MIRRGVALLHVEALTVRRGTRTVLENFNMEIESGNCIILTGDNGSGKSTLIESIAGIIPVQSGKVTIQRPFGLTLQSGGINGDELVDERLEYATQASGVEETSELLKHWNLEHRSHDRIGQLSGGLYRRMAVLQGMMPAYGNQPRICLLDEPSEGLDDDSVVTLLISYTTIDRTCQMTPRQDKMPGLLSAEGTYWGLGLDQRDDNVVIAGYYRDMVTGGTYQDLTSIFLIETDSPLSASPEDWEIRRNTVLDIDMYPRSASPIQVEIGKDDIHILHQNIRDDSTGEERLGMFYAHGNADVQNWAFSIAVGDDATSGQMVLVENSDGSETIFTAWREGSEADAELVTRISPPSWLQGVEDRTPARGLSNIALIETDRGIQVLYDAISPTGPKLHYGLLSDVDGSDDMWLSDRISSGVLLTAWRTDDSGELHFTYVTSNGLRVRKMVEDPTAESPDHGLLDEIRLWLNLDESTFQALMNSVLITFCSLSLFVTFVVTSNRRRRSSSDQVDFVNENLFSISPAISLAAILTIGVPVVLATKGTVLLARGLTSRI